jgi:hypothetical protein
METRGVWGTGRGRAETLIAFDRGALEAINTTHISVVPRIMRGAISSVMWNVSILWPNLVRVRIVNGEGVGSYRSGRWMLLTGRTQPS